MWLEGDDREIELTFKLLADKYRHEGTTGTDERPLHAQDRPAEDGQPGTPCR